MNFSITPSRACGSEISEQNAEVGTAKDAFITAAVRTLPARRKQGFEVQGAPIISMTYILKRFASVPFVSRPDSGLASVSRRRLPWPEGLGARKI